MISLKQGNSVNILTPGGETIDMTSTVATYSPILTAPSLLSMIRNTTAQVSKDNNGSTIYRMAVKPNEDLYISYNATAVSHQIVQDPRTLTDHKPQIYAVRINPKLVGTKYGALTWDMDMNTIGSVFGIYMAGWIEVRRTRKHLEGMKALIASAKAQVITGTPKTFGSGAHYVDETFTASNTENFLTSFTNARQLFLTMGSINSPAKENSEYKHMEGCGMNDFIAIINTNTERVIKSVPNILASVPGFNAFTEFGITGIYGVPTYFTANLPQATNFIMTTTGLNGSLGYEEVGQKIGGKVIEDPSAPGLAYRLQVWDQYTLGVVAPFQILVSSADTTPPPADEIPQVDNYDLLLDKIQELEAKLNNATVKPDEITLDIPTEDKPPKDKAK